MNKIIIVIISLLLTFTQNISATSIQESPAIDMVSYEQSWLDNYGTIALRNNTSSDIHNISFILEYLDMSDNPMDYETFSYDIVIAPGMTKKLDVPAYESGRNYHYYKTKDNFGHPAFKIRYKLTDYNFNQPNLTVKEQEKPFVAHSRDSNFPESLMILFVLLCLGMYIVVAVMAQRRNRNPIVWILLSFLITPILTSLILLAIGKERNQ